MNVHHVFLDEPDLNVYLITWVTHKSHISKRLIDYTLHRGKAVLFNEAMRNAIFEYLKKNILQENYRVYELNVLDDHVHLVLACSDMQLEKIVRILKGYSSYSLSRQMKLSVEGEGRQSKLWAKGFSHTWLQTERHVDNALDYVRNNHMKHNLPPVNQVFEQPENDG